MKTIHTQNETKFPFFKTFTESPLTFFERYILGFSFVQNAIKEAEIRAFPVAQKDVLETMADDIEKRANELASKKLSDLLSNVDLNKIVTLDKQRGIVYIGGSKADDPRLANLKAEAEFFLQSDLWGLLYESAKELASRTMFVSGETLADMQKGKSILYTLSAQKNIVETFKSYQPKQPIGKPGMP